MKKSMVALLAVLIAVFLTACGGTSLKGKWELEDIQDAMGLGGELGQLVKVTMEFGENEVKITSSAFGMSDTETQKYKVDGNLLYLDDEEGMKFSIKGNVLNLIGEDGIMTLKKVK